MNNFKAFLFFTFFWISTLTIIAQNRSKDSLIDLDFSILLEQISSNFKDTIAVKPLIEAYITKAKLKNNTNELARGFYYKIVSTPLNSENQRYYDSILNITKNIKGSNFPSIVYFDKGVALYKKRNFKEALDNYLLALENNNGSNKNNLEFLINKSIASLKNRIGFDREALILYQKCWSYAINNNVKNIDSDKYLSLMASLSNSFRKNKFLDSAFFYNIKGLKESILFDSEEYYYHFVLNDGVISYFKNDIISAKDSLQKGLEYMKSKNDLPNIAVGNYYLGKAMSKLGHTDEALNYFKGVDTVFQLNKDILPETRGAYHFLTNYYKDNGDLQNELIYIEKLITVDSVLNDNYKFLSKNIVHKYDTPKLLEKKESIIKKLNNKNSLYTKYIYWILTTALIAVSFGLFQFYRKKVFLRRFNELVKNNNRGISESIIDKGELNIPDDIINHIVSELDIFEKEHKFLNTDVNLVSLAKEFKTNSNYLSKIINHFKTKNFTSYLSELRVDYAFNKIKEDIVFRKYTVKAIANEVGFKNAEPFSKAFYKHYKIYPSFYIKSLDKIATKKT